MANLISLSNCPACGAAFGCVLPAGRLNGSVPDPDDEIRSINDALGIAFRIDGLQALALAPDDFDPAFTIKHCETEFAVFPEDLFNDA